LNKLSFDLKVTNQASFDHIKVRISELQHYCDETVPRILIGNKDDNNNKMDKVVLTRDAREYAEKNNLPLFEISVRDNKNITEAFNELTRVVLKRRLEQPEITPNNVMGRRLDQPIDNDARKQCCPM
jgi:GTPase SAR1 family protein